MALAPIDLQTLFSQMDKVGKTQAAQKDGATVQQAVQGTELQRKTEEQIRQVNETQNAGEGPDKVNDQTGKDAGKRSEGKKKESENEPEETSETENIVFLRDPSLGNKIDISY
ncbi:MAG: hypothetical protein FWB86_00210 [Treponema sp.]|nr:hypothetical protein [Treponema sp.]MCL2251357.1 hypothetical protein [Treponema sp.]